jgi:hypothetical protein
MKNTLIADKGLEQAEKDLPEYQLEQLSSASEQLSNVALKEQGHMYSTSNLQTTVDATGDNTTMPKPEDKDTKPVVNFSQADMETAAKKAADDARAEEKAQFAHQTKCATLINGWQTKGKLTPAMLPGLAEFMAALDTGEESAFSFSKGKAGDDVTTSPFDFMCTLLESMPNDFSALSADFTDGHEEADADAKAANFSAPESHTVSTESAELDAKAQSFMAKNPNTTYIQAVKAVS